MKIKKIIKSPSNIEIIQKINELADHSTDTDVISWHGYISTEAELKKITNAEKGDVYFVTSIGYSFVYTGVEWDPFAPIIEMTMPSDDQLKNLWEE